MARRRDMRLQALAVTLLGVAGFGALLALWPAGGPSQPAVPPAEVAWDAHQHVADKRQAEIAMRFEQGVMMLHARRYDYAIAALHRVLELAPRLPEAHVNLGFALSGSGEHAAARDFFLSAIELNPRQVNAYYGLAVSLEQVCDLSGAIGAMRTYVHLSQPDDRYLRKAEAALWEWQSGIQTASCAEQAEQAEGAKG